jgi:integrase
MREDYGPFFKIVGQSDQRLDERLLRWSEINWSTGLITKKGKNDRLVVVPITPAIKRLLWPLRGHHPEFVFTYVATRTWGETVNGGPRVKGQRYPLTYNGVKSAWKRIRAAARLVNFRFHDFRHDVGTKLLRETGNL